MKNLICFVCLFTATTFFAQRKKNVLFIGNSYTAVNNLPQMIKDLALPLGDTLLFDQSVFAGYRFVEHCNNPATWTKIPS